MPGNYLEVLHSNIVKRLKFSLVLVQVYRHNASAYTQDNLSAAALSSGAAAPA